MESGKADSHAGQARPRIMWRQEYMNVRRNRGRRRLGLGDGSCVRLSFRLTSLRWLRTSCRDPRIEELRVGAIPSYASFQCLSRITLQDILGRTLNRCILSCILS